MPFLVPQSPSAINQSFSNLPELVLQQMLKTLSSKSEQNSVINCRRVCKEWDAIIQNTPEIMRNITFQLIRHPKHFNRLAIVKHRKIKSIQFTKSWHLKPGDKTRFFNSISNTVEKVHFAFQSKDCTFDSELFNCVLEKCLMIRVRELIVDETKRATLFWNIAPEIEIAAANNIRSILVKVTALYAQEAAGLRTLLLKLPQLEEFKLVGDCKSEAMLIICTSLIEYLNGFRNDLQLKKLRLPFMESCFDKDALNSLLILCGKCSVKLDGVVIFSDFNSLVDLCEIESSIESDQQNQEQGQLFKGSVYGKFIFDGSIIPNLDRLGQLDVQILELSFRGEILPEQFHWVGNLQDLKVLSLKSLGEIEDELADDEEDEDEGQALSQASLEEFGEALLAGLPELEFLQLWGDIFSSSDAFLWAVYFPNLNQLSLFRLHYTTDTLIADLTALESLSHLEMIELENLEDISFIAESEYNYSDTVSDVIAPAITCFKSLTYLVLFQCRLLTNDCVSLGITLSKTLEKFKIASCENITEGCLNSPDYEMELGPDSFTVTTGIGNEQSKQGTGAAIST